MHLHKRVFPPDLDQAVIQIYTILSGVWNRNENGLFAEHSLERIGPGAVVSEVRAADLAATAHFQRCELRDLPHERIVFRQLCLKLVATPPHADFVAGEN